MARKIVGFEKFMSKKGTPCCAVSCEMEYKDRDGAQHCGTKVETVMAYGADNCNVFTDKAIGKNLAGFIGYSNGVCIVQSPVIE